jgi:hypothetical protein
MNPLQKVALALAIAVILLGVGFVITGNVGGLVFVGLGLLLAGTRLGIERDRQRLLREATNDKAPDGSGS